MNYEQSAPKFYLLLALLFVGLLSATAYSAAALSECRDGIDNDGDGLIDLNDPDCQSSDDPREIPACRDKIDNDGDGKIDFSGISCSPVPGCAQKEIQRTAKWGTDIQTMTVACDGEISIFFAQDDAAVVLTRGEDSKEVVLANCDDGYGTHHRINCGKSGDNNAVLCNRDGSHLATLPKASPTCPGPAMEPYRITVKAGDVISLYTLQDTHAASRINKVTFYPTCTPAPADPECAGPDDPSEEITEECRNSIDDDGDDLIDFPNDPGCDSLTDNDENDPLPAQCRNLIDDDGDQLVDAQDPGCWTDPENPASYDPERDNEAAATSECQDKSDNDNDGLIDSQDPGCWNNPHDPATYDRSRNDESSATTECQDQKDNDQDLLTDAQDPGCWDDSKNPATYNPSRNAESAATSECQDKIDNDGDNKIDYPSDQGCDSPSDYDEGGGQPDVCSNGLDDDNDGYIDFGNDDGCTSPTDNDERDITMAECDNGLDDDGDGKKDFRLDGRGDPGCDAPWDDDESDSHQPAECSNQADDDGDGLIDGSDPGCWSDPKNPSSYDPTLDNEGAATSECQDGTDNDGDNRIDYPADAGCAGPGDYDEEGGGPCACENNLDDDADGYIDYGSDDGCTSPTDTSERDASAPVCDNGVDDDKDGKADFRNDGQGDPDCYAPWDSSEEGGSSNAACNNRLDDDSDGYVDFGSDDGCTSPTDDSERDITAPVCDNGLDDDGDGRFDYPDDTDCSAPWGISEGSGGGATASVCSNGLDDDSDGYTDYGDDDGCISPVDTSERDICAPTCDNGRDDDGDGALDFSKNGDGDPGCFAPWDMTEDCTDCPQKPYADRQDNNRDFVVNLQIGANRIKNTVDQMAKALSEMRKGKARSRRISKVGTKLVKQAKAAIAEASEGPGNSGSCTEVIKAVRKYKKGISRLRKLAVNTKRDLRSYRHLQKQTIESFNAIKLLKQRYLTLAGLLLDGSKCQ